MSTTLSSVATRMAANKAAIVTDIGGGMTSAEMDTIIAFLRAALQDPSNAIQIMKRVPDNGVGSVAVQ